MNTLSTLASKIESTGALAPSTTSSQSVDIADLCNSDHPIAKANAASWLKANGGPVKAGKTAKAETAPDTPAKTKESPVKRKSAPKKAAARSPARTKVETAPAAKSARSTKVEMIAAMLKSKNGCTAAEVMKAAGWPSVSMPQQAKAAGLKLKKKKDGRVTRYFAA